MVDDRSGKVGVMYVGSHAVISARFPEIGLAIQFEKSIPRYLEPHIAAMFTPTRDWVIGVVEGEMHDGTALRRILVRRAVALGDVIAVHAALQGVMNAYPNKYRFIFQVAPPYVGVFSSHPRYADVISTDVPASAVQADNFVCLDGLLEKDHAVDGPKNSRVLRTWEHLFSGRPDLMHGLRPDFSLTLPETSRRWAFQALDQQGVFRHPGPIIAVQCRAVQKPRNMGDGLIEEFTRMLVRELNAWVVLIEHDAKEIWSGDRILGFPGSDVLQGMALLQYADCAVTMDSGAMWMAHCTATPLVLWLGPTPPETKCNYHPFYGTDGVVPLKMWEWIGCPNACYEAATWCDFSYRCVKTPPRDRFFADTLSAVSKALKWNSEHGKAARQKLGQYSR